jgi:hypothetical protein
MNYYKLDSLDPKKWVENHSSKTLRDDATPEEVEQHRREALREPKKIDVSDPLGIKDTVLK